MGSGQRKGRIWRRTKPALGAMLLLAILISTPVAAETPPSASPHPAQATSGTGVDLKRWLGELRQAGPKGGAEIAEAIRRVDPEFPGIVPADADGSEVPPFAAAELFWGQTDDDPAREAVVQVRFHAPEFVGAGERAEIFWIGIFDQNGAAMRFVGKIHRSINHCNFDGKNLGLVLDFGSPKPGRNAHLWVREQVTESCGTLVDFRYVQRQYRIVAGRLEVSDVDAPEGMSYDRTHPEQ